MDQLVPFHRSASVPTEFPALSVMAPTAVHAEGDVHDTLFRKPPPAGLGVGWISQLVPFHRSAKVTSVPELFP
jgi:hypothetical protein